jgi:tetratricopeptide (TPR) repeat protein
MSRERGRGPIDPCIQQPLTELARAVVWVGAGADAHEGEGGAARPAWRRLWEHSLAVIGDVQERVGDAEPSMDRALELLEHDGTDEQRALVFAARADLAARQNRAEEAVEWADRAEALIGAHPALYRIRGDGWARVWQFERAEAQYQIVAEATPRSKDAWRALAQARGSLADDEAALAAATRGLALQPRDEWLLRTQTVALEHLDHRLAGDARDAFVAYRLPDHAQELRFGCDRRVPYCARDRVPVPTIVMRTR